MNNKKRPTDIDISVINSLPNPFTDSMVIRANKVRQGSNEGKQSHVVLESDRYCKFYISADYRKAVAELTPQGKSLLLWIMQEIKEGQDYLWLNVPRYSKENNVLSLKTINAAITDLCHKCFILDIRDYKDVYWINPNVFFRGSRINKYPDKVIF